MIGARPFEAAAAEILARGGFRPEVALLFTKGQRECLELECQEFAKPIIRDFVAVLLFASLLAYPVSTETLSWKFDLFDDFA